MMAAPIMAAPAVGWAAGAALAGATPAVSAGTMTCGGSAVGGAAAKYSASSPQSAIALSKQLASEAQLGEMASGGGLRIAGVGAGASFRNAQRIADTYGGNAADWVKMSSSGFRAADGTAFATHWVENIATGQQVEQKVVIDIFGGP